MIPGHGRSISWALLWATAQPTPGPVADTRLAREPKKNPESNNVLGIAERSLLCRHSAALTTSGAVGRIVPCRMSLSCCACLTLGHSSAMGEAVPFNAFPPYILDLWFNCGERVRSVADLDSPRHASNVGCVHILTPTTTHSRFSEGKLLFLLLIKDYGLDECGPSSSTIATPPHSEDALSSRSARIIFTLYTSRGYTHRKR